jgi:hypothetical protein
LPTVSSDYFTAKFSQLWRKDRPRRWNRAPWRIFAMAGDHKARCANRSENVELGRRRIFSLQANSERTDRKQPSHLSIALQRNSRTLGDAATIQRWAPPRLEAAKRSKIFERKLVVRAVISARASPSPTSSSLDLAQHSVPSLLHRRRACRKSTSPEANIGDRRCADRLAQRDENLRVDAMPGGTNKTRDAETLKLDRRQAFSPQAKTAPQQSHLNTAF